jgi:hypothetical protein
MRLTKDWKDAWKWFSIQVPVVNTAFLATWASLPAKFQDILPIGVVIGIAVALLILGVVGRVINQTTKEDEE